MSFNTVFVVTEMRLGGRERVVSRIAGALNKHTEVAIFSVWKRSPFFLSSAPLYYDKNTRVNSKSQLGSNNLENKKWMKPIISTLKQTVPYTFLQRRRLNELIDFLDENNVKNVVLTDLTSTFAKKIRKKLPNINIVSWIHMQSDAFFEVQYKEYSRELKQGLSAVDLLVSLTPSQASDYRKHTKNTVYIPNPMPDISKNLADLKTKTILIVARIDIKHKGLDYLSSFVDYLPNDWQIKVVGSGKPEDEKVFKNIVDQSNNRIIWEPAVDGEELSEKYQQASVFLMPSRFEGFPLTLGEAMSYGLPIIAFDLDGTRTILKDGDENYGILVDRGNVEMLGKKMISLINDERLRTEMSDKSIKRLSYFSEAKVINRWIEILNK